ncbi:MAG TPA: hypothetical protein VI299_01785, partial [Polyangiales bacterium]
VREQVASRLGLVRNARAERVLQQLVELSGVPSACLYLMVSGKAVLSAEHGEPAQIATLHREVGTLVKTLHESAVDDGRNEVLARLPPALRNSRRVVPLLAENDNDEPQLVALLVLGDERGSVSFDPNELSRVAAELVFDEETEVVLASDAER